MTILATGGAGYIGSHTVLELLQAGHEVLALDNLDNSSEISLQRVAAITGKKPVFIQGDVNDAALLTDIFARHDISAVIHFAGLKAVGESVTKPLDYYQNNVGGTVTLCRAMAAAGVFRLVFSSSATVYGEQHFMPIKETSPTGKPTNPYGRSKLMIEEILQDLAHADDRWSVALLRYFNPVGAHESGLIGEDPSGIPNNLLPYISQVAIGARPELMVYGDDYPTRDGTGVRDYIHVVDLAKGHLAALDYLQKHTGVGVWNLGTGRGYSVLEMIHAFAAAAQRPIPYRLVARRAGDIAECWSDPDKAWHDLGWKAKKGLAEMVADAWRWQFRNPDGYRSHGRIGQAE
jgi:UDP-glucose 4-epimerase